MYWQEEDEEITHFCLSPSNEVSFSKIPIYIVGTALCFMLYLHFYWLHIHLRFTHISVYIHLICTVTFNLSTTVQLFIIINIFVGWCLSKNNFLFFIYDWVVHSFLFGKAVHLLMYNENNGNKPKNPKIRKLIILQYNICVM